MIFKAVRDGRPYPDHGLSPRDWANVAPRSVRLPRALNPDKMNQMSNKLQALTIFAAPFLLLPLVLAYWSRWYFESEVVFAAIVLVSAIIGGILYWVCLDSATQTGSSRRDFR